MCLTWLLDPLLQSADYSLHEVTGHTFFCYARASLHPSVLRFCNKCRAMQTTADHIDTLMPKVQVTTGLESLIVAVCQACGQRGGPKIAVRVVDFL